MSYPEERIRPMNAKLRVALWLESYSVPAWFYACIAKVMRAPCAEVVLLMVGCRGHGDVYASGIERRNNASRLYHIYRSIDRWLSPPVPDAQKIKDVRELLSGVPIVEVDLNGRSVSDTDASVRYEEIRRYDLDVIVTEEMHEDLPCIESTARYGMWSHCFGGKLSPADSARGFWEVMRQEPVTRSSLVCRSTERDTDSVLYSSASQTDHISIHRNNSRVYWKSSEYVSRVLRELHETGGAGFNRRITRLNPSPLDGRNGLRTVPKWHEVAFWVTRLYVRYLAGKVLQLFRQEQWCLLYDMADEEAIGTENGRYRRLVPPKDRYWADPFVMEREGIYYIFFEEYDHKCNKGHISCLTIDNAGKMCEPTKILEADCHLSYPCVFEHEGMVYMIPEKAEEQVIDLYQCTSFPYRWKKVKTIVSGVKAVDATLLRHGGLWWLFANLSVNEGTSTWDELFLYYSNDLFDHEWIPHPRNPVVSDARSARPAGRVYQHEGHLYRPSQDCSRGYGYGININRILTLTTRDYDEVCVEEITPSRFRRILATHTINHAGKVTVMDGMQRRMKYGWDSLRDCLGMRIST